LVSRRRCRDEASRGLAAGEAKGEKDQYVGDQAWEGVQSVGTGHVRKDLRRNADCGEGTGIFFASRSWYLYGEEIG
jgi:hypothetical protein